VQIQGRIKDKMDKEQMEKEAMKQILSGRIENPYTKPFMKVARKVREYVRKGKEVPIELKAELKFLEDEESAWKL